MNNFIEEMKKRSGLAMLGVVLCGGLILAMGATGLKGKADGFYHDYSEHDMSGHHLDYEQGLVHDHEEGSAEENSQQAAPAKDPCLDTPIIDQSGVDYYNAIITSVTFYSTGTVACKVGIDSVYYTDKVKKNCGNRSFDVQRVKGDHSAEELCHAMAEKHNSSSIAKAMSNREFVNLLAVETVGMTERIKLFRAENRLF